MKSTVIKYGSYGALAICLLFILSLTLGKNLSYSMQEVIGYASMVIALSFVFFGIRHFRDAVNDGVVSFGKALLIGILISLITSIAFGILDFIYVKYINPDFITEYYNRSVEQLRESLPPAEFEVEYAKLESQKEFFLSPVMSFIVMASTVFLIGFIISLISGLILQRKKQSA